MRFKGIDLVQMVEKYDMKIRGVIHVGAHHGEENKFYRDLGIKNRIYFEPGSQNFISLKRHISGYHPKIQKALGNENKMVFLNLDIENGGMSNSILKPKEHLTLYPNIHFGEPELVEMIRLDDSGLDLTGFNLIVIDVQGYELEVFKGAAKTLENIDYIISEINKIELYEDGATVDQVVAFLSSYGFKLVEEVWDKHGWGDGLFIKTKI